MYYLLAGTVDPIIKLPEFESWLFLLACDLRQLISLYFHFLVDKMGTIIIPFPGFLWGLNEFTCKCLAQCQE